MKLTKTKRGKTMQLIIIFIVAFWGVYIAAKPFTTKASRKIRERYETNTLNIIANDAEKAEQLESLVREQREKLSEETVSQIDLKSHFDFKNKNNSKYSAIGIMNIFLLTKIVNRKGKIVRTKSHRYIMPIFLNPSRANMRDGIVLNASADIPVCEHTTSILTCYSKPFFGGEKKDSIAEGTSFTIESIWGENKYIVEEACIAKLSDLDGSFIEHRDNTIILIIREQGYKSCKIFYCVKACDETQEGENLEEFEF